MLSVVIIAKNEADRIEAAICSVAFADEVVVVDSGSTDDTVARAEALGARVVCTDWPGFVAQKNRAWCTAKGDWVLSLDADERVSPELAASIQRAVQGPARGFWVARRNIYLGTPLRGGHWYPDARVRLARRDRARWVGENPHDRLEVDGPVAWLDGDLLHEPYRSFAEHLHTIDHYAAVAATALLAKGRRARPWDILVRPLWRVFAEFVLQGGWRDGALGLRLALLAGVYTELKWCRVAGKITLSEAPGDRGAPSA